MFMYRKSPSKFENRFDELIEAFANGDERTVTCTLQMLVPMAKAKPEVSLLCAKRALLQLELKLLFNHALIIFNMLGSN